MSEQTRQLRQLRQLRRLRHCESESGVTPGPDSLDRARTLRRLLSFTRSLYLTDISANSWRFLRQLSVSPRRHAAEYPFQVLRRQRCGRGGGRCSASASITSYRRTVP